MNSIFRYDSPLMRFMMLITNLICLNILWLLCCIPVVTAGAATKAMYFVIFQYITKQDDAVIKPFFRAFRENFRSVTAIWILNLLIGAALAAEFLYMSHGAEVWLKVCFGVILFIYGGASAWLYPLLARYDAPVKQTLLNSFTFSTRYLFTTAIVTVFYAVPIVLAVMEPDIFWKISIVWLIGVFSLTAYLNGRIILSVLKTLEEKKPTEE